ncbi:MAG: RtcB family protein, partial [Deltaproteobacteria bacterium]|nr:RtcB family protein [Deltaproteobacteria bacterium]
FINIAHNYAALESHYHQNVMVHRKGATRALPGEYGMIPGSQGTPSYIVQGKGNEESFHSCSHGAGRRMGRKQAQRQLDLADERKILDDQGIIHALRSRRDLDEAAGAYKEIDQVIDNQLDLVEVVVSLRPLAVSKG